MFMLFLSGFIVFAFVFEVCDPSDAEVIRFLHIGDTAACVFLLIDVFWRWGSSKHKVRFWLWGWIDLISCIPNFNWFRLGRLVYFFRIIYYLRTARSALRMTDYFFSDRVKSTMAIAATLLTGSMLLGGLLVLKLESGDPNASIRTAFDALWWSVNTITTVGSSDCIPMTRPGRIVGMVLMFVGISLFSTTSALLTQWLIGAKHRRHEHFIPNGPLGIERPGNKDTLSDKKEAATEAAEEAADAAQVAAQAAKEAVQAQKQEDKKAQS